MNRYLQELLKTTFIRSSQMAYVEGAKDTAAVLCHMDRLLRYWLKGVKLVPLKEEIAILKDYAAIIALDSDRAITLELPPDAPDRFIQRRGILEFLCEHYPPDPSPEWIGSCCHVRVLQGGTGEELNVSLRVATSLSERVYHRTIRETRKADHADDVDR